MFARAEADNHQHTANQPHVVSSIQQKFTSIDGDKIVAAHVFFVSGHHDDARHRHNYDDYFPHTGMLPGRWRRENVGSDPIEMEILANTQIATSASVSFPHRQSKDTLSTWWR